LISLCKKFHQNIHTYGDNFIAGGDILDWRWGRYQPVPWILPGLGIAFITIIMTLNLLIRFLPTSINEFLLSAASAFIGAASAGFIIELLRGRGKLLYYTMTATWFIGLIIHLIGHGFLERNLLNGNQMASIPFVGAMLTSIGVTVIPGLFTGSIIGGIASFIPDRITQVDENSPVDILGFNPNNWPGYEKACVKCGQIMPFDSIYCSHCGSILKRRISSQVRYCRFCGSNLHFKGDFCPECGREIVVLSKPKVYVSQ
jgi:RNA polymerase subunit RPABC4/transcription elongation factor Spt4